MYNWLRTEYQTRYIPNIPSGPMLDWFNSNIAVMKFNLGDANQVDPLEFWAAPSGSGPVYQPHVQTSTGNSISSVHERHIWFWGEVSDNDPTTTHDAQSFMQSFVTAWKSDTSSTAIPSPTRFLLDTEVTPFRGTSGTVISNLLESIKADSRASAGTSTEDPTGLRRNLPKSGQPTTSTNKPFTDWLSDADAAYDNLAEFGLLPDPVCSTWTIHNVLGAPWDAAPSLPEHLDLSEEEDHFLNYAVATWYSRLWYASFDDALKRAAYDVLRDTTSGWGSTCQIAAYNFYNIESGSGFAPLISSEQRATNLSATYSTFQANSNTFAVANYPFTFGWTFDQALHGKAPSSSCSPPHPLATGDPTNVLAVGTPNVRIDSMYYHASGRTDVTSFNTSSADLDAPVFYGVVRKCTDRNGPYFLPDHQRPNLYMPSWRINPIHPSSSFDAYEQVTPGATGINACPRDDLYLGSTASCKAPLESIEQASVRVARTTMESIINTGSNFGSSERVLPWIPMVGAKVFGQSESPYYYEGISHAHLRDLLMMLRAKGVGQFQVFGNQVSRCNNSTSFAIAANWADTERIYNEVYNLQYDAYAIELGNYVSNGDEINTLSRTNLELDSSQTQLVPNTANLSSEPLLTSGHATSLLLSYKGNRLAPTSSQGTIRVVIEASAERTCENPTGTTCPNRCDTFTGDDLKDIRGKIYAFDWTQLVWKQLKSPEFTDGSYAYYAPRESCLPYDSTYAGVFRTMRRTWDFKNRDLLKYVKTELDSNGQPTYRIDIKLVHTGEYPFEVKHDLVQVAYLNTSDLKPAPLCPCDPEEFPLLMCDEPPFDDSGSEVPGTGSGEGDEEGMRADVTYDGQQNEDDLANFIHNLLLGSPAADLNNDRDVDSEDIESFFSAYDNSGGL